MQMAVGKGRREFSCCLFFLYIFLIFVNFRTPSLYWYCYTLFKENLITFRFKFNGILQLSLRLYSAVSPT